jgi:thiol:disulfide interchange protein DsbC
LLGLASSAFALNEKQIRAEVQKRLGTAANVRNVTASPIPGLFEVQVNNEIFYTDTNAKYLIQGEMVELATGNNVTAKRQEDINRIKWSELPQAQAFKVIRGNGSRQIAVFSDPNCGYCKRLEKTLQQLDNVTIYNYLIPILSADSSLKSKQIWCASDQQKVWNDWMLNNQSPTGKSD